MKRRFSLALLLCMAMFASCNRPVETRHGTSLPTDVSPELSAIDSLMWQRPDSALAMIVDFCGRDVSRNVSENAGDPLRDVSGNVSTNDRHYAQLLLSELLYKNYMPQSNRNELLHAVEFFDSLMIVDGTVARHDPLRERNAFLDARAHYIKGAGYYECDSVVEACAEYLKALEIMEGRFDEKALIGKRALLMANANNRLGDLFSEQFMMESSIACYENALVYCKISPTSPNGVSSILYRIGKQYDKLDEIKTALSYYHQALENMVTTDNPLFRDIVTNKALCAYQMDGDAKQALNELNRVLVNADTENERLHRYLTIGGVFFYEGNYDSALFYLKPVFGSHEAGLQDQAANYLYIVYDEQGDREHSDSIMRFVTRRKKLDGDSKALVSKLEDMFNGYQGHKREKQAEISRINTVKRIIVVLLLTSIAVSLVIFFVMRVKNKKMMELQQTEIAKKIEEKDKAHKDEVKRIRLEVDKTVKEKEMQLEKEKRARRREQEKLHQGLLQREAQVNALEKALNLQREEMELRRAAFLNEPICQKINNSIRGQNITARNSAKHNIAFTEEEAAALKVCVLRHYPYFESALLSKNPKMNEYDLQLCQLYLLGLDERQIAVLMCKTYSAIKKRANVLKTMLGLEENLQAYLLKSSAFQ